MTLKQRQVDALKRAIEVISKEDKHIWDNSCVLCQEFRKGWRCLGCPFTQFDSGNTFGCAEFGEKHYGSWTQDITPEEIVSILYQVKMYWEENS